MAWEVNRVITDFVAAQRCQDAGLDGIERSMTGHVVDRFLSPLTNLGEDNLDGSVENRLAFPVHLAHTVRYAEGPDYIVRLRMCMGDNSDGGLEDERMRLPADWQRQEAVISAVS